MGSGSKAPAPPDYTGAAQAQAQGSRENVIEQTYANRPDVSTPWGSVSWTRPEYPGAPGYVGGEPGNTGTQYTGGSTGGGSSNPFAGFGSLLGGGSGSGIMDVINKTMPSSVRAGQQDTGYGGYDPSQWAMNVTLPPEVQAAVEAQQRIQQGRSRMGEQMLGQAGQTLSQGVDWSALPGVTGGEDARNAAENAIYGRETSRLDPMWQQRQQQQQSQLAAQGLEPGTEAYTRSMGDLNRAQNDAYQQAMYGAITGGGQEASRQSGLESANRARALQEAYQKQYGGINALNAFLQGQQVQMPQFPGFGQAGQAQAPQYLQAAQLGYQGALNQYGANQAQLQGLLSGAGGMVGLPFMF